MSSIKIYNQEGKEVADFEPNKAIFGLPWNADLVHQAVSVASANQRQVLASTKDRSNVSGGGKKPWKQKGTGRARHGSIRSPLWRGGGITFGPSNERSYKVNINQKMAKKAFLTVLSAKAKDDEILVLDDIKISAPKTKEMAKIFANFPKVKNGLLILTKSSEIKRAAKNLAHINILNLDNLNILESLKYKYLIFTKDGIEYLNKKYGASK